MSDHESIVVDMSRGRADAGYRAEVRARVAKGRKLTADMTGEVFDTPDWRERDQQRSKLLSEMGVDLTPPSDPQEALAKFVVEGLWRKVPVGERP